MIDFANTGMTAEMTEVENINFVEVFANADPKVNGATDQYKVIVTAHTPILSGDKLSLTFPSTMGLPASDGDLSCDTDENLEAVSCDKLSS